MEAPPPWLSPDRIACAASVTPWLMVCPRRMRCAHAGGLAAEPAAAGAYNALKKAGKEKNVIIVSVDGGCAGITDVGAGVIAATSQQYPLKMAAMGVAAGVQYAKDGKRQVGYTDTGVTLIAAKAQAGVQSADVKTGLDLCWGNK